MSEPVEVVDFYGVYLLYCINPKFKGRTYIGFTRDANRRIMQHNRGTWAGGACRTNNRGPWKMALIVHGFPNNISALRFEWAWQNPNKTTRLQHLELKKIPRKESEFQFKLRVLTEMLRVCPWYRLPLTIRWLEDEYFEKFPDERKPPEHMNIVHGPVKCSKLKIIKCSPLTTECLLCSQSIRESEKLLCTNADCDLISHLSCLADLFLSPGEYVPVMGPCPLCQTKLIWGDLIRKRKCYVHSDKLEIEGNQSGDLEGSQSDDDVICTQEKTFVDNNSWFLNCTEDL